MVVDLCFPSSPETEGLSRPSLLKVEKLQEEALHAIKLRAKERHPVCCTLRVSKLLLCLWAIQRLSLELRKLEKLTFYYSLTTDSILYLEFLFWQNLLYRCNFLYNFDRFLVKVSVQLYFFSTFFQNVTLFKEHKSF